MASNTFSNKVTTPTFSLPIPQSGNSFSRAMNNVSNGTKTTPPPVASTPLKSTTTKNIDGSSITHEFHAPPKDLTQGLSVNNGALVSTNNSGIRTDLTSPKQNANTGLLGVSQPSRELTPGLLSSTNSTSQNTVPRDNVTNPISNNQGITEEQARANIAKTGYTSDSSTSQPQTTSPIPPVDNSYGGLIGQALLAQQNATKYDKNLAQNINNINSNPNYSLDTQQGRAGTVATTGAIESKALQQGATNLFTAAGLKSPVTQFGVLTDPTTGLPISGGSAGSAAFQGGVIGGQQAAGQNYAGMAVANNAAKGVKATLDDFIQNNPTINSSALTAGNALQQWVSGKQLGDAKTQTFLNDVQEYVSTLAPILGIGGTPTDAKTYIANSFVNARASGQSIQQVIQGIETLANNKLNYYAT